MRTKQEKYEGFGSVVTNLESSYYFTSSGAKAGTFTPPPGIRQVYIHPPADFIRKLEYADDLPKDATFSRWNSFNHYKMVNDCPVASNATWTAGNKSYLSTAYCKYAFPIKYLDWDNTHASGTFGSAANPTTGLPALYVVANDQLSGYVPANLDDYVDRSLSAMLPSIRPQLSIVNSIIELKDWRTALRSVSKFKAAKAALSKALSYRLRSYSTNKWSLKKLLGSLTDSFLQTEFNILPTYSDVYNLYTTLKNAERKAQKLLRSEGERRTRHFYCDLVELQPSYQVIGDGITAGNQIRTSPYTDVNLVPRFDTIGGVSTTREVTYPVRSFHAQIQCSFYFTQFQREHAKLLALLDGAGINYNPAIIWNAIPWSFAIDWVIGVGRWLDQFKMTNLEPVTVIHRYLWTTKVERSVRLYRMIKPSATSKLGPITYILVQRDETSYKRKAGIPSLTKSLTTSGISSKEFALATALYLSRLR